MADEQKFKLKIPPALQKYLKPDAPKDAKMLVAKGLVPMPPAIQTAALSLFMEDDDQELRDASQRTLVAMPIAVMERIASEPAHPKTLDFFGRLRTSEEGLVEKILLNPNTSDDTYVFLADKVVERHTTILMNNQVRLLRTPAIAEAVKRNPNALRSALETMISFLRINGIALEGESAELTNDEIQQILEAPELDQEESLLGDELIGEDDEELETDEKEQEKQPIQQVIANMNVSQKIKLALKGNKEVRTILIKDSNKIVATSVIKSPRITDQEVLGVANNRSVHDEVIRIISTKPDWTKNYQIQVALANNPKTPFQIALRFARQLIVPDLKKLAGNKNVPSQLRKLAKEWWETKRK